MATYKKSRNPSFFSLAEMKQPVNQWLCIAFLGVFCFWVVLFYFTQETQIIAENYAAPAEVANY
jgi:hypothetical protein